LITPSNPAGKPVVEIAAAFAEAVVSLV